jgi:nucleoside-diphosphate-sugar epimerase
MKAFVTGGTGFVGSHLVTALLGRGDEVVVLARDLQKVERVFPAEARPQVVKGTLDDRAALASGMADADLVFHVAGVTAAPSRKEFFRANAEATRLVAEVATEVAPRLQRFVYVSSQAASGPSRRGVALTESADPRPLTAYGASKLAGERALQDLKLPWTVVRPPTVYGPRDLELLRLFRLVRFGLAPVFGDGSQQLSLIYAVDLAAALLRAAASPRAGCTYFAAHTQVVTSRELVTAVYKAVQLSEPRPDPRASGPFVVPIPGMLARPALWMTETAVRLTGGATLLTADKANEFYAEGWVCSAEALHRDTGWTAQHHLELGLQHTAQWYRSAGWL